MREEQRRALLFGKWSCLSTKSTRRTREEHAKSNQKIRISSKLLLCVCFSYFSYALRISCDFFCCYFSGKIASKFPIVLIGGRFLYWPSPWKWSFSQVKEDGKNDNNCFADVVRCQLCGTRFTYGPKMIVVWHYTHNNYWTHVLLLRYANPEEVIQSLQGEGVGVNGDIGKRVRRGISPPYIG